MDMNPVVMYSSFFKNICIYTAKDAKLKESKLDSCLGSATLILGKIISLSVHICKLE